MGRERGRKEEKEEERVGRERGRKEERGGEEGGEGERRRGEGGKVNNTIAALGEGQGTHCMAHCSGSSEGSSNKPWSTSMVRGAPRK